MLTIPELTDMGEFCFWKRIGAVDSTHLVLEFFYRCTIRGTVILLHPPELAWASLVAQRVKHLPTVRETWVRSLGQEDPLEKEMATHSSTLTWKIPWTEKPGRQNWLTTIFPAHLWTIFVLHQVFSVQSFRIKLFSASIDLFLFWTLKPYYS